MTDVVLFKLAWDNHTLQRFLRRVSKLNHQGCDAGVCPVCDAEELVQESVREFQRRLKMVNQENVT